MSKIMVLSNIMNFQDFDILSNGMVEIRGLYWRKMWFRSFLSNQFFTNCHMEQKTNRGVFFIGFPLIIPSPIGSPKEDPHPHWTTPFLKMQFCPMSMWLDLLWPDNLDFRRVWISRLHCWSCSVAQLQFAGREILGDGIIKLKNHEKHPPRLFFAPYGNW